jgi:Tn3 transposase DDE domain
VRSLKERLSTALVQLNRVLPQLGDLRIFHHNKKEERGLWALAKLEAQAESRSLGLIKEAIGKRYGILDLLDVFVEVDRIVDLTRFFTHSGTKEVRSRDELRPLLMLDLFAEGTNTGIRRVANANNQCSYDELLYERLYLSEKGIAADYPNLAGIFARAIRWDLVEQQYDEMVKAAVALKGGTATAR